MATCFVTAVIRFIYCGAFQPSWLSSFNAGRWLSVDIFKETNPPCMTYRLFLRLKITCIVKNLVTIAVICRYIVKSNSLPNSESSSFHNFSSSFLCSLAVFDPLLYLYLFASPLISLPRFLDIASPSFD